MTLCTAESRKFLNWDLKKKKKKSEFLAPFPPPFKWLGHLPPASIGWILVILLKGRTNAVVHLHFLYSSSIIHILCSTTWLSQVPFIPILNCTHIHTLVLYSSLKDLLALIEVLCTAGLCGIEITLKWGTVERLEAQDDNPETACRF